MQAYTMELPDIHLLKFAIAVTKERLEYPCWPYPFNMSSPECTKRRLKDNSPRNSWSWTVDKVSSPLLDPDQFFAKPSITLPNIINGPISFFYVFFLKAFHLPFFVPFFEASITKKSSLSQVYFTSLSLCGTLQAPNHFGFLIPSIQRSSSPSMAPRRPPLCIDIWALNPMPSHE